MSDIRTYPSERRRWRLNTLTNRYKRLKEERMNQVLSRIRMFKPAVLRARVRSVREQADPSPDTARSIIKVQHRMVCRQIQMFEFCNLFVYFLFFLLRSLGFTSPCSSSTMSPRQSTLKQSNHVVNMLRVSLNGEQCYGSSCVQR